MWTCACPNTCTHNVECVIVSEACSCRLSFTFTLPPLTALLHPLTSLPPFPYLSSPSPLSSLPHPLTSLLSSPSPHLPSTLPLTSLYLHLSSSPQELMYESIDYYVLIGILCGLAIYNSVIVELPFPTALYKKLLNR